MEYVEKYGQVLEHDYPYTSGRSDSAGHCKSNHYTKQVFVSHVEYVKPESVSELMAAIAAGPTSVSVDAKSDLFKHYHSGILNSKDCGTHTDHAINAVGYAEESGQKYYIIRNSWGTGYGDHGYLKIAAVDGDGICAVQDHPHWVEMKSKH